MIKYIKIENFDDKICERLKIEWQDLWKKKTSWVKFTKLWKLDNKIRDNKAWMIKFVIKSFV